MLRKILIANRGEIAVRVHRTCKRLGLSTATVHSEADRFGRHVREIGESILLGPAPATESYLDIDAVIRAAVSTGADAVHPGYGFLAENPAAASAVEDAGLVWIGPDPSTIELFGDKANTKRVAIEAEVPVIPGVEGALTDLDRIADAVVEVGLPALLKATAGGGGRGMRLVESLDDLDDTIRTAMSEAQRSFAAPDLMIERYLVDARHIEVQIAGDGTGEVIHLFERECSLQRRHQKIIEEAPAPRLSEGVRSGLLEAACVLGRHVSYRGVGTVEFIVAGHEFYLLEVNPRIQVEHPVTEQITGLDIVELQIRIANGQGLGLRQEDVHSSGHSIEARVYAEDTDSGFLPAVGRLSRVDLPAAGDGLRVERSVDTGDDVSAHYDPMIAKVVCSAPNRAGALARLVAALGQSHVGGVDTNLAFLVELLIDPAVVAGTVHTGYVEQRAGKASEAPAEHLVAVAGALWFRSRRTGEAKGPWTSWENTAGWRLAGQYDDSTAAPVARLGVGGDEIALHGRPSDGRMIRLRLGDRPFEVELRDIGVDRCIAAVDGTSLAVSHEVESDHVAIWGTDFDARISIAPFLPAVVGASGPAGGLVAPMTGQVLRVEVNVGVNVDEGDVIAVMESMKLELHIVAHRSGVVSAVHVAPGTVIERGSAIAEIAPAH